LAPKGLDILQEYIEQDAAGAEDLKPLIRSIRFSASGRLLSNNKNFTIK
jgi:hypothetical protein